MTCVLTVNLHKGSVTKQCTAEHSSMSRKGQSLCSLSLDPSILLVVSDECIQQWPAQHHCGVGTVELAR